MPLERCGEHLSGAPRREDSGQMRGSCGASQRIANTQDSLLERAEFELSGDFDGSRRRLSDRRRSRHGAPEQIEEVSEKGDALYQA
jgi:hypothetical protein